MTLLINIIQTPLFRLPLSLITIITTPIFAMKLCCLSASYTPGKLTLTSSKGNLRDKVEELSDFVDIPKRRSRKMWLPPGRQEPPWIVIRWDVRC